MEAADQVDFDATSPTCSRETSEQGEVKELHERLREVEEADDTLPEVHDELGKILFKKKTVTEAGYTRQYVASRSETVSSIKRLLRRRWAFMAARGLDDLSPSGHYLFTPEDRKQVMKEWKQEFHAKPEQIEQQKRDSWKPMARPGGDRRMARDGREYSLEEFEHWYGDCWGRRYWQEAAKSRHGDRGPNSGAVHSGKHSRFARHLQLEAGSKTLAELIIYVGRYDEDFLKQAHEAQGRGVAAQPAAGGPAVQAQLKRTAAMAKLDYRKTCILRRRLEEGKVLEQDLAWCERENLRKLEDGSLLQRTNEAVAAYGHGTLRHGDERLEIGGSTGGVTRFLLDGYTPPDVSAFLSRR